MILDKIENAHLYRGINQGIEKILSIVGNYTSENYPKEKFFIDGDKLFLNFFEYDTQNKEAALFEAHRKYVDVMYMVEGSETICVKNVSALSKITKEYDAKIDALLANIDEDYTEVKLLPGHFVIFFPGDAHAPACNPITDKSVKVKKIVGKVML